MAVISTSRYLWQLQDQHPRHSRNYHLWRRSTMQMDAIRRWLSKRKVSSDEAFWQLSNFSTVWFHTDFLKLPISCLFLCTSYIFSILLYWFFPLFSSRICKILDFLTQWSFRVDFERKEPKQIIREHLYYKLHCTIVGIYLLFVLISKEYSGKLMKVRICEVLRITGWKKLIKIIKCK